MLEAISMSTSKEWFLWIGRRIIETNIAVHRLIVHWSSDCAIIDATQWPLLCATGSIACFNIFRCRGHPTNSVHRDWWLSLSLSRLRCSYSLALDVSPCVSRFSYVTFCCPACLHACALSMSMSTYFVHLVIVYNIDESTWSLMNPIVTMVNSDYGDSMSTRYIQ